MNNWLKYNLFGPVLGQCLFCLEPTSNQYSLCEHCESALPDNKLHCLICSSPIPLTQADQPALICGQCQKNPPSYNTSLIPFLYTSPLKQSIAALKFHRNLSYVPLLAYIFIRALKSRQSKMPECILPVPLHPKRLQQRGFNQALELLSIISTQLGIPLDYSLCQRNKDTPFQSGLSAKQRKQNLRNAFIVSKPQLYKHIAIFDGVVTTGTTVNELARKLKASGAEIIEVWAIARTISANQK